MYVVTAILGVGVQIGGAVGDGSLVCNWKVFLTGLNSLRIHVCREASMEETKMIEHLKELPLPCFMQRKMT